MDLAEIMLIGMDRSSLKREEQWFFFEKPTRPPSRKSRLKILRHLRQ